MRLTYSKACTCLLRIWPAVPCHHHLTRFPAMFQCRHRRSPMMTTLQRRLTFRTLSMPRSRSGSRSCRLSMMKSQRCSTGNNISRPKRSHRVDAPIRDDIMPTVRTRIVMLYPTRISTVRNTISSTSGKHRLPISMTICAKLLVSCSE